MELLKSEKDETMDSGYSNLLTEVQELGWFGSIRYSAGIYDTVHYKHKVERSTDEVWKSVLKSDRVQWIVTNIARDEQTEKEDIMKEASRILNEMAYKEHLNLVRGFGCAMYHAMNALYKDGVFYNSDAVDFIKLAVKEHPVILMPSHRCYMDFLVLSVLSVHLDLPLPAIASGMDFMAMKGVGFLLRSSGAFFMRRSFGSDKLYWALFTEYVHSIIINGDRTMEFFIEGTRSRSGKSLNPKLGLLSVVAEPYLKAQIYDVTIVPVSISYDRILEESLYAYELLGVPKPKESTSGLLKVGSIFQNNYGSLHVHFAEPISLRKECGAMDRGAHACYPRYMLRITAKEQRCLTDLAYKVIRIQQKNMVLGLWSLVATILLQAPEGIHLQSLTAEVQWLLDLLRKCDIKVRFRSGNLSDVLKGILFQYGHLVHVDSKDSAYRLVTIKGCEKLYLRTKQSAQKFSLLPDVLRDEAAIVLMLASYRNHLLHVLVRPSLFVIALGNSTSIDRNSDDEKLIFQFLRDLFYKEFIFSPGHTQGDYLEGYEFLCNAGAIQANGSLPHINARGQKLAVFLKNLIRPFCECYAAVCQYMSDHHQSCEIKQLSDQAQIWMSQNVKHGLLMLESLSKDMMINAIHGASRVGAVELKKEGSSQIVHIKRVPTGLLAQQLHNILKGRSPTLKSLKRESETKLLKDAKEFANTFDIQKQEIAKADHFPENIDSEVGKLRQELLKRHNELHQIEERDFLLQYKLESLQEELHLLKRDYERTPKLEEIEQKKSDLRAQNDVLRKENAQRQLELKNLREDLEAKHNHNSSESKELDDLASKQESLKNNLVQIHGIPTQIAKEIDKSNKILQELNKKFGSLDEDMQNVLGEMKIVESKKIRIKEEKKEVEGELYQERIGLMNQERDQDKLLKDIEFEKEREAIGLSDRATLDLHLRHAQLEKKTIHDTLTRKQREKDRDLRQLKKLEQQFKVVKDQLQHTEVLRDKAKSMVEMLPRDDSTSVEKRKQYQSEVDEAKRRVGQQNTLTDVERVKVDNCVVEEEQLIKQQEEIRAEVVELTRVAQIKADEREQKARDMQRAEQRSIKAINDLRSKDLSITDHKKKYTEVQQRLQESAKLYDIIKNERNKCVSQIQASTQKAAEMREKIKILSNEIEILRTTVSNLESNLQKARLKQMNSLVLRDSLRNERAKALTLEADLTEKREQLKAQISKLNTLNNQAEEEMVQLRKRYENAVQHRNDRGVQLVEREEEVCIFYEKSNIQDIMISNGDVAVRALEEEIRFLRMQLSEEHRLIELARKNQPNRLHLNDELITLQIQLAQCQDRMRTLERKLEDPEQPSRVRLLGGKDPTPTELHNKMEELEIRLAHKEEMLLDKDLVFDQASRLANRVQKKVNTGQDDSLTLAKKVNELPRKIKDVTRKMMALVSELAMQQASALQLQQSIKEKESLLEQCYRRMEQGEPPSEEIEHEWKKMLQTDEQKLMQLSQEEMHSYEQKQYELPSGVATTAEPRPNAYIPDEEGELPIPRPYGSLAPFKPSEPGSSMRHIRKPIIKPIEI